MKISIARRLRPFIHRPGVWCVLPWSTWQVRIFPTRVDFQPIGGNQPIHTLEIPLVGPVSPFTVEIDLERGFICVFGQSLKGYFRYEISRSSLGICFRWDKPIGGMNIETVIPVEEPSIPKKTLPRLSMGVHKAQNWDAVVRRADPREWFPFLLRLGQMIPCTEESPAPIGTLRLFHACQAAAEAGDRLSLTQLCQQWWKTAFSGVLVPRLVDEECQGILPTEEVPKSLSPLSLLSAGSRWMQSLFFQEEEAHWDILPCLLPSFVSGRLTDLWTSHQDHLCLEWSKHRLQKMIICSRSRMTRTLQLPKGIRTCRMRQSRQDPGRTLTVEDRLISIDLSVDRPCFLDRFKV